MSVFAINVKNETVKSFLSSLIIYYERNYLPSSWCNLRKEFGNLKPKQQNTQIKNNSLKVCFVTFFKVDNKTINAISDFNFQTIGLA